MQRYEVHSMYGTAFVVVASGCGCIICMRLRRSPAKRSEMVKSVKNGTRVVIDVEAISDFRFPISDVQAMRRLS